MVVEEKSDITQKMTLDHSPQNKKSVIILN